jgi:hypothetical protein
VSVTESDLTEAVEAMRNESADVPYPMPAPLDHEHRRWKGGWTNTRAVTPVVYRHRDLPGKSFTSRDAMLARLAEVQER